MKQRIGTHVSISGGYKKALERADALDEDCAQIFSSSPMRWASANVSSEEISEFKDKKEEYSLDPIYFHAAYLINLADTGTTGERSVEALTNELQLASELGVRGSVVHLGSFKNGEETLTGEEDGYEVFIKNIKSVLSAIPDDVVFIAENAGTRKIGMKMEDLSHVIAEVDDPRMRVCLDTCHLHAAGYDLSTREKLDAFLEKFDDQIGLERLELWHMNDSKDPAGSLRDRHENIGKGKIDIEIFQNILNHPKLKEKPFILETPGFDTPHKDEKNIATIKSLIS